MNPNTDWRLITNGSVAAFCFLIFSNHSQELYVSNHISSYRQILDLASYAHREATFESSNRSLSASCCLEDKASFEIRT